MAVLACFSGVSRAQEADGSPKPETSAGKTDIVSEIYLARDDGSGKAGDPATDFRVTDVPIYCVVSLNSNEPTTVRMNLVAVEVAGVRADTKVVSTSYTTKDRQNRVNFTGRPDGKWVAGKYRADIYVGDKLVWSRNFVIGSPGPTPKAPTKPVVAKGRRA